MAHESTDQTSGDLSALAIAEAVRSGRRSAVEVTRRHLDLIAVHDPQLNAFQEVRREAALADAAAVDADPRRGELPLAGVPLAVKDNMAVAGLAARHGSAATPDTPASADDPLVARMRAAGCVVVGTTRMPELAIWGFTASLAYGATRNPRDLSLDPGGSTGGGAAAVAAGLVPLALGTDGGGSLRIPAAYCGVVGLKPSAGLVPPPGGGAHWHGLTVSGPLARTVPDAAAALAVLAGDPALATPAEPPAALRVARSLRSPSPLGRADAHQRAAVEAAAATLQAAGHAVIAADPAYPPTLMQRWQRRWWAGVAADVDTLGLDPTQLEPRTRALVRRGRRVERFGGPRPAAAMAWRDRAAQFLADYDVLLTPATARGPGPAGGLATNGYVTTFLASARAVPFTPAWNLAGFPAVVITVGERGGRPLAVQLVGAPGSERLLLAVAALLHIALPVSRP